MLWKRNYWAVALLLLLLLSLFGCAAERGISDWPRGISIPWSDLPKPVVDKFHQEFPDEADPSVESCGEGQLYRFETSSGSVIYINQAGEWLGTLI